MIRTFIINYFATTTIEIFLLSWVIIPMFIGFGFSFLNALYINMKLIKSVPITYIISSTIIDTVDILIKVFIPNLIKLYALLMVTLYVVLFVEAILM